MFLCFCFQNQIAAQQALYVKQQQQHQHHHQQLNSHMTGGPPGTQNDFFNKPSLPDQLCSSFDFLAVNNNPAIINVQVFSSFERLLLNFTTMWCFIYLLVDINDIVIWCVSAKCQINHSVNV